MHERIKSLTPRCRFAINVAPVWRQRGKREVLGAYPWCNCSGRYRDKMATQPQVNWEWEEQEEVGRRCHKDVQTEEQLRNVSDMGCVSPYFSCSLFTPSMVALRTRRDYSHQRERGPFREWFIWPISDIYSSIQWLMSLGCPFLSYKQESRQLTRM